MKWKEKKTLQELGKEFVERREVKWIECGRKYLHNFLILQNVFHSHLDFFSYLRLFSFPTQQTTFLVSLVSFVITIPRTRQHDFPIHFIDIIIFFLLIALLLVNVTFLFVIIVKRLRSTFVVMFREFSFECQGFFHFENHILQQSKENWNTKYNQDEFPFEFIRKCFVSLTKLGFIARELKLFQFPS